LKLRHTKKSYKDFDATLRKLRLFYKRKLSKNMIESKSKRHNGQSKSKT